MPNLSAPVDNKPWPAERFYRDAPLWSPSGVVYGVSPAVSYGTGQLPLSFAVAGNVITVQLGLGRARVRGILFERTDMPWTSGMAGDQPHEGSAAYPLNSASQPRIDRLVLRRDLAAGVCYPLILQGTPAVNPAAPALTQSETGIWDMPMFAWRLAGSNSTAISNIVDERPWISPNGGRAKSRLLTGAEAFTVTNSAWTLASAFLQQIDDGLASVYLEVARAAGSGTVTPDANGEIFNSPIGAIAPGFEPAVPTSLSSGALGRGAFGYLTAAGEVGLAAVAGPGSITAGNSFSLAATFGLAAS